MDSLRMYFNTVEILGPTHWKNKPKEIQPVGTMFNEDVLAISMGSVATMKWGGTQCSYKGTNPTTIPGNTTGASKRDLLATTKWTSLGQQTPNRFAKMVTNVPMGMVTDHNNDKATRTKKTKWIGNKSITHDLTSILWLKAGLDRHERRKRGKREWYRIHQKGLHPTTWTKKVAQLHFVSHKEFFMSFALVGLRPNKEAMTMKPIGAIASNGY